MVSFDLPAIQCAIAGGLLLGLATSINYIVRGKVTGMSGTIFGVINCNRSQLPEKLTLIGGMLLASALVFKEYGYGSSGGFQPFGPRSQITEWTQELGFAVAGFMVGFGTKLGNGCTSGHGLCGLPRLSPRSWVAVITFLLTAIGVSTWDYYFGLGPIAGSTIHTPDTTAIDHSLSANVTLGLGILLPLIGIALGGSSILDKIVVFLVGALFALGLMVSGMSRRSNILHFLQINNSWNPALLFVLGCGLLVNFITFTVMRKRGKSLNGDKVFDPKNSSIDWRLVLGAFCFGVGWGIAGICPGPFLVLSSVATIPITVYWGVSMVVGMHVAKIFTEKPTKSVKTA